MRSVVLSEVSRSSWHARSERLQATETRYMCSVAGRDTAGPPVHPALLRSREDHLAGPGEEDAPPCQRDLVLELLAVEQGRLASEYLG